jgi:type IV pilus assembly protein PilA
LANTDATANVCIFAGQCAISARNPGVETRTSSDKLFHVDFVQQKRARLMCAGALSPQRYGNKLRYQRGFSLIELLIVVAIIIILVTVALPNLTRTRIGPNETSAQYSLQAIVKAENQYSQAYPDQGYTCSLQALGPPPRGTPATASASDLIPGDLANGTKAGYIFALSGCTTAPGTNSTAIISFQATAVPQAPGQTGQKAFCTDQSGRLYYDLSGNGQACLTSGKPSGS